MREFLSSHQQKESDYLNELTQKLQPLTHLQATEAKILGVEDLPRKLALWKFLGKRVVFTNGCFDIVHRGHITYLLQAAELGDILIVGLNSDASAKRLKGESRPLQDELSRAMVLAALECVSFVLTFDEDTPLELIKAVQPDILVKGSDYKVENIAGAEVVQAKGGKIVTIPFVEGYSTSKVVEKLRQ
ncbi:MAG: D-glycero-beta-D-manno-heptose 1-phosphate adenylyltransferase [Prevotellaceae bacterium]|jgi:rfaE bifunctional protein nucleotidyltransferase chain/domain|nr:D-glycero-beta-D-manno-heptose 1-phosphate adenylyltransferase [Prevotellaceae bacterium]